jgi:deoxycytidylate deaminase
VPRSGGGQYWPDDVPDHRDFQTGRDTNRRLTERLVTDILQRLQKARWLASAMRSYGRKRLLEEALRPAANNNPAGPLASARVTDLLEFSRVVHAEMAAVSEAARRGVPIEGGTVYTTTYPCHLCARLIIAAGIRRVIYVDPYAKSVVPELFGNQISSEDQTGSPEDTAAGLRQPERVVFASFTGVAPRLFDDESLAAAESWLSVASYPVAVFYAPQSPFKKWNSGTLAGMAPKVTTRLTRIASALKLPLMSFAQKSGVDEIGVSYQFPWGVGAGVAWNLNQPPTYPRIKGTRYPALTNAGHEFDIEVNPQTTVTATSPN